LYASTTKDLQTLHLKSSQCLPKSLLTSRDIRRKT
jgi:hypothetical protein